jgi:iron complex outermembrane receptor protein
MTLRVLLLAGAALLPFAATPVLATEIPAETAAETAAAAPADQSTSVGTGQSDNDTIVVTARRRAETAQDVPLAISVVGGDHIDATGAFNVGRLQQLTPTLQFYSSNPRNTSVNIRGLGAPLGLTNDGIEQGVGIYVDDVYFARVASSTFDFLDVKQIEVLRGPQGTLYGKNTTAGAINITTRQPMFDFEGRAEATVGNLGFVQVKTALSGPLSETVAVRLAGSYTKRDGTIYNVTTKRFVNEQDNLGLRGQLLWKPIGNLEITLAGDFSRQNPECCTQVYVRTGATQRPLERQYALLAAAQNYAVPSTNPYDRLTDVDSPLRAKNEVGGVSLKVKLDTGIGTLTSITAWRYWSWDPSNDRDFLGLPITSKSNNPSHQDQYSQELRLSGETGKLAYTLGAFGFYQKIRTQGIQQQGAAASRWLINPTNALSLDPSVLNGLTADNDISFRNTSAAIYGKLAWKLTDSFSIQPGFRLNYDRKKGRYTSVVTNGAGNRVVFKTDAAGVNVNSKVELAQLAVLAPQRFLANFSDWNFSGDVTAAWDVTRDVHLYATYAKSFKTGGINLNGVPNDAATGVPLL